MKIRSQVLGENHPDMATSYNNIGNAYCNRGDYDKALEFYQKALKIRFQVLGENHPDVAYSYMVSALPMTISGITKRPSDFTKKL